MAEWQIASPIGANFASQFGRIYSGALTYAKPYPELYPNWFVSGSRELTGGGISSGQNNSAYLYSARSVAKVDAQTGTTLYQFGKLPNGIVRLNMSVDGDEVAIGSYENAKGETINILDSTGTLTSSFLTSAWSTQEMDPGEWLGYGQFGETGEFSALSADEADTVYGGRNGNKNNNQMVAKVGKFDWLNPSDKCTGFDPHDFPALMVPVNLTNKVTFSVKAGTILLQPDNSSIATVTPNRISASDGQVTLTFSGHQHGSARFSIVDANSSVLLKKKGIAVDVKDLLTSVHVQMLNVKNSSGTIFPTTVPAPQDLQAELDRIFRRQANAAIHVDGIDQNFVFNYPDSSGVIWIDESDANHQDRTSLKSALENKYPAILTDSGLLFAAYVKSLSPRTALGVSKMGLRGHAYGSVIRGDLEDYVRSLSLTDLSSHITAHEIGHQLNLDLWNPHSNPVFHSERGREFLMTPYEDGSTQPCRLDRTEWNQVNP
jgi:hypothetical protein